MNNEYLYEKNCVHFSTVVLLSYNIVLYSGALIRGVMFVGRVWLICSLEFIELLSQCLVWACLSLQILCDYLVALPQTFSMLAVKKYLYF